MPAAATIAQQYARLATSLEAGLLRGIAQDITASTEIALSRLGAAMRTSGTTLTPQQTTQLAEQLAAASDSAAVTLALSNVGVANNAQALQQARTWISRHASRGSYGTGSFEALQGQLAPGFQRNHLNQNAAFRQDVLRREVIPEAEGLVVPTYGDAIFGTETAHWRFHRSLENFGVNFAVAARDLAILLRAPNTGKLSRKHLAQQDSLLPRQPTLQGRPRASARSMG